MQETTAREVVMLALREFSISDPSSNYSLCEVSVGHGNMIKQRRLPDQLSGLAERIPLAGRYYLKNNMCTEQLVTDDLAPELQVAVSLSRIVCIKIVLSLLVLQYMYVQ